MPEARELNDSAHCNLANATSHEQQSLLHTLSCDVPFDVVYVLQKGKPHLTTLNPPVHCSTNNGNWL
jgi:hypothetical protein